MLALFGIAVFTDAGTSPAESGVGCWRTPHVSFSAYVAKELGALTLLDPDFL